jgi:translation initiation factor 2B subunit (eIF-2B alpha/beta/delta family)
MIMADALNQSDPASLYREDFAAWLDVQVAALRERRFADLDLDNLIEEVESIRRAEMRSAQHHARVVIAQLLQLAHSTLSDPGRSWKSTAMAHRHQLEMILTPTSRQELEARLEEVHRRGRRLAATVLETEGTPPEWLAEKCPYTLAQILADDWYPTNVYGFDRLES